jgi:hypothetical protein
MIDMRSSVKDVQDGEDEQGQIQHMATAKTAK